MSWISMEEVMSLSFFSWQLLIMQLKLWKSMATLTKGFVLYLGTSIPHVDLWPVPLTWTFPRHQTFPFHNSPEVPQSRHHCLAVAQLTSSFQPDPRASSCQVLSSKAPRWWLLPKEACLAGFPWNGARDHAGNECGVVLPMQHRQQDLIQVSQTLPAALVLKSFLCRQSWGTVPQVVL